MALASTRLGGWAPETGHRTLAEKAFVALHDAIVRGELRPGERLPIEELADVLDMSPMPIREALRRLDAVGLVENVPHRGARVTELSLEDLRDVYEARLALEPLAVQHAAERFDRDDTERGQEALVTLNKLGDRSTAATWAAHTAFHFSLYEPAGSAWLVRLIRPLWESSERYRLAAPTRRKLSMRRDEHERILRACVDHQPAVARAELHNHLARTANMVARSMGGRDLFEAVEVPRIRRARA
ncbi:MAG TPA: GntR family transcriptional regulator [Thermoleophilaceae bacterium]|nr:GntR family transcriptional regulator [Thermoleophilaceae bacterium]